jgi:hypothetical protein
MPHTMRTLLVVLLALPCFGVDPSRERVTVHEWGTFTTVADENGKSVLWRPFTAPDLPCFVERLNPFSPKGNLSTYVRMETPVLYFYSPQPATVSVRVDFPQGRITEWYPKAKAQPAGMSSGGGIEWNRVEIRPGETPVLPVSQGPSHYFAARATDAVPVRVNGQSEKLLFYRGIGNFGVPVEAKFGSDGRLSVRNTGADPLPIAIYFENRGGKSGYRVERGMKGTIAWDAPTLTGNAEAVQRELVLELVGAGLFVKEAEAMIETWRDSWFEEGTRIIYLVPRAMVDAVLPLRMEPAPAAVERVFVGRVELLAPWRQAQMLAASEPAPLASVGRFLEPFAGQIRRTNGTALDDTFYRAAMGETYSLSAQGIGCVK